MSPTPGGLADAGQERRSPVPPAFITLIGREPPVLERNLMRCLALAAAHDAHVTRRNP
jgi:uncharacterized protein YbjT (DUF2867 family)